MKHNRLKIHDLVFINSAILITVVLVIVVILIHQKTNYIPAPAAHITNGHYKEDTAPIFKPVKLPHDWVTEAPNVEEGWYRFRLNFEETPRELHALYFPTVTQNIIVYLNGNEIANSDSIITVSYTHLTLPTIYSV